MSDRRTTEEVLLDQLDEANAANIRLCVSHTAQAKEILQLRAEIKDEKAHLEQMTMAANGLLKELADEKAKHPALLDLVRDAMETNTRWSAQSAAQAAEIEELRAQRGSNLHLYELCRILRAQRDAYAKGVYQIEWLLRERDPSCATVAREALAAGVAILEGRECKACEGRGKEDQERCGVCSGMGIIT